MILVMYARNFQCCDKVGRSDRFVVTFFSKFENLWSNEDLSMSEVAQKFKQSAWAIVNILKLAKVIIKRWENKT